MLSPRKLYGIFLAIVPFLIVLIFSFCEWRLHKGQSISLGYSLLVMGGFVSISNFFLLALRHPIHNLIKGRFAEYRWISGIPLFGFLSVVGFLFIPKSILLSIIVLLFLCVDLGGIQWFVILTWKDDSLWNPK